MSAMQIAAGAAAAATHHSSADARPSGVPVKRDPALLMQPERLAALQPSRLSASRALMVRAIRERWAIERLDWSIDAKSRGTALYRITTPGAIFDFPVYSFEYRSEGRTGRIIGRAWDMMGALIEGPASDAEIEQTGRELPKLYQGRATPRTLIWCRANRSSRAFDHTVASLAAGRQPDLAEIAQVGYLMRNTGLDGNGTFGTRSFRALEPGHVLGAAAVRTDALRVHDARVRDRPGPSPRARSSRPTPSRSIRGCNATSVSATARRSGSCCSSTITRTWSTAGWTRARKRSLRRSPSAGAAATPALRRLRQLVGRAITFREQDRMEYEAFAPSDRIAAELHGVRDAIDATLADPRLSRFAISDRRALRPRRTRPARRDDGNRAVAGDRARAGSCDTLGSTLAVDEEFTTRPACACRSCATSCTTNMAGR